MNKQELIDKAVERFKGIWRDDSNSYIYYLPENHGIYQPFWVAYIRDDSYGTLYCTKEEFTKRARELGWINGYKWGVEYPTNGKKPDLPDDVVVTCHYALCNVWGEYNQPAVNIAWNYTSKFRIVDEQYKPVEGSTSSEVEQVQADWYDYDKQQAIGLPPIGAKIEFNYQSELTWGVSHVVAIHRFRKDLFLAPFDSSGKLICANELSRMRPLDYNRKVDEERQKFVEAAISVDLSITKDQAEYLYNAGCRFK